MTAALSVFVFTLLSLGMAFLAARGRERAFLWRTVLLAWLALGLLTALVNDWLPFSGAGDDESYFYLANPPIDSLSNLFDLTGFVGFMEQPGYPWLLSLLNAFTGHDLLAFKLLNLCFLILLAITWYRIATLLESPDFAQTVMVSILLLTPLWYYVFVLLKDMTITLLQSLFLLGLVELWRRNGLRPWLLIGAATFALIEFRTGLVLQNSAVLMGAVMLKSLGRSRNVRSWRIVGLILGGGVVTGLFALGSDPEAMARLGIYAQHRILGSDEMLESVRVHHEASMMNRELFPLLYLFSETAGLSPQTWAQFDAAWLRGVLALPWIFFVVPFFLLGLFWLTQVPHGMPRGKGLIVRLQNSRLVASPWGALLLFVLSTVAISWQLGDTTRWRMPDMPVIATIAMAGWYYAVRRTRYQVLVSWVAGAGCLFAMFYLLRGA